MPDAAPVYCDACDERTATPPLCEDCRTDQIANLTAIVADDQELSNGQALWLLAEVGRLRDTIYRRGEELDRLAGQVQDVRDLTQTEIGGATVRIHESKRVTVGDIRRALDGGVS